MNKKKVLVGVTASFDSLATVLLLKLQNYEVNAIHVVIDPIEKDNGANDRDSIYCLKKNNKKLLDEILSSLSVPLYYVDMKESFKELVLNNAVLASFMKEFHAPCLYCNKIKILALYEKLFKLNADYIATGHYAKIRKLGKEDYVSLYQHSEEHLDQHKFLAGLDQTVLSKLILPLGDLTREKVTSVIQEHLPQFFHHLSLGENHGFCTVMKDFSQSIRNHIPPSMNKKNRLFLRESKTYLNEAYDNTEFEFGKVLKIGKNPKGKDQLLVVTGFNYSYQTVYVNHQQNCDTHYLFVQVVEFFGRPKSYGPIISQISINDESQLFDAEIYFKGLNYALISLKNKKHHYVPSKSLVFIFTETTVGRKLMYLARVVNQGQLEGEFSNVNFRLAKLEGDYPF